MRTIAGMTVLAAAMILSGAALAQNAEVKTGPAAFGGWQDDAPGVTRHIRVRDLPAAKETRSQNRADVASAPQGTKPKVPQGFAVELVASGIESPRIMTVAPNGDLFVADSKADQVRVYRLAGGKAKPAQESVYAAGLNKPYGMAFYPEDKPEWLYVANTDSVVRFPYRDGDLTATGEAEMLVDKLPSVHHWTKDIVFSADGKTLYVAVGSGSNVALDMAPEPRDGAKQWIAQHALGAAWDTEERRAAVLSFSPDGKDEKVFATGLRNCSGIARQPGTGAIWCAVNERDEIGPDTPFEYATAVKQGAFYGWPWYFIGPNEDPRQAGNRPDLKDKVTVPDVLFQAHSAPLGITFYDADAFPADYKGDAFIAFHGSWNRDTRTGYKVVRMMFENGKPTGQYQDFMTGFVIAEDTVWGRPVGVAVGKDGSLYVSEDGSGTIWRVTAAE